MRTRLFCGAALMAVILSVAIGMGPHAVADPLGQGPAIRIPVVPAQPPVSDAINDNLDRAHRDTTNGSEEDQALQSGDEDGDDDEDNDLDNIFGEEDPEETALIDRLNDLNDELTDLREERDRLEQEFQDTQAGRQAREEIAGARAVLSGERQAAYAEHEAMMAEAMAEEKTMRRPNYEGRQAAKDWLFKALMEADRLYIAERNQILLREMRAKDPDRLEEYLELREEIQIRTDEVRLLSDELDPTKKAEAPPKKDDKPDPKKDAGEPPAEGDKVGPKKEVKNAPEKK